MCSWAKTFDTWQLFWCAFIHCKRLKKKEVANTVTWVLVGPSAFVQYVDWSCSTCIFLGSSSGVQCPLRVQKCVFTVGWLENVIAVFPAFTVFELEIGSHRPQKVQGVKKMDRWIELRVANWFSLTHWLLKEHLLLSLLFDYSCTVVTVSPTWGIRLQVK